MGKLKKRLTKELISLLTEQLEEKGVKTKKLSGKIEKAAEKLAREAARQLKRQEAKAKKARDKKDKESKKSDKGGTPMVDLLAEEQEAEFEAQHAAEPAISEPFSVQEVEETSSVDQDESLLKEELDDASEEADADEKPVLPAPKSQARRSPARKGKSTRPDAAQEDWIRE